MERYENEPMQNRVRALFQDLFERQRSDDIHIIDAGGSFDQVSRDILKIATDSVACVDVIGPLRKLGPIAV